MTKLNEWQIFAIANLQFEVTMNVMTNEYTRTNFVINLQRNNLRDFEKRYGTSKNEFIRLLVRYVEVDCGLVYDCIIVSHRNLYNYTLCQTFMI